MIGLRAEDLPDFQKNSIVFEKTDKKQIAGRKGIDGFVRIELFKKNNYCQEATNFLLAKQRRNQMNVKKIAMLVALIGMSGFFLAACGNKEADNSEIKDGKQVDFQKDAVDKKTKTVDGKEVTEYTMPDGNVIQIPADGEEIPEDGSGSSSEAE